MKKFLIILGIILINTPAAFALDYQSEGNGSSYQRDRFVFSTTYSAGKFNLSGREGVPPGNAPRR